MTPTQRGKRAMMNQASIGPRKSARLVEASQEGDQDVIVEQEAESGAEQPEHPMPFPLRLDPFSMKTAPGEGLLEHDEVAKIETTLTERENVLKALRLILEAGRAITLGPMPDPLDCNHDLIWDWRSMELSATEYGAFAYAVVRYWETETIDVLDGVPYDWTPLDSSRGILSVRKKCAFQEQITRILHEVIVDAMWGNELLKSLIGYKELEPQTRASVLTGTVEGLRSPCRCFRFQPKREEEEARPYGSIQDFVLEVGMGKKNQVLPQLAYSYIERGTLCVMTISIQRQGEYDFDWSYSLYRRGEVGSLPGQVTRYKVICAAQDVRVKEKNKVDFPAGLTLFDFVPPSFLQKYGVTRRDDKKAIVQLEMSWDQLDESKANIGDSGEPLSWHLQNFDELMRKRTSNVGEGEEDSYSP